MRLIDADVLKQHIDKLPALPDGNFAGNHSALKALINMQPTIEPEPHWIPCSERLPEKDGWYLVTYLWNDNIFVDTAEWFIDDWKVWSATEILAWQCLPKPYKGDADD